jgi:LmbE family N-acetylglucosaminyl deacetylase
MKPTPTSQTERGPLLVFGAHPDDIEFGCGGVVALETRLGRAAHLVNCSRGESATHGTPEERTAEAHKAAKILGATVEFVDLDGDAHLELRAAHTIKLAAIVRRVRPAIVLAPTLVENQHPDHWRLGRTVQEAARLARYGGVKELRELQPHAISQLFYYAITPDGEPDNATPFLVDVSAPEVLDAWTAAMKTQVTQTQVINYIELQLTRAHLRGLRAGIGHAIALYPNDPIVIESLASVGRGARKF